MASDLSSLIEHAWYDAQFAIVSFIKPRQDTNQLNVSIERLVSPIRRIDSIIMFIENNCN